MRGQERARKKELMRELKREVKKEVKKERPRGSSKESTQIQILYTQNQITVQVFTKPVYFTVHVYTGYVQGCNLINNK